MKQVENHITDQASRLKKIRLYLGMTRQQFGIETGISWYTIRAWELGAKSFTEKGAQRVIAALKNKLNFKCSTEWLMNGVGCSPISMYEDNSSGITEFNQINFDSAQENVLQDVSDFKRSNKEVNIIVVSDNKFYPIAKRGDYVGLTKLDVEKIENSIGDIVLLHEDDHNFKFGNLIMKKSKYYIDDFNSKVQSLINFSHCLNFFVLVWYRKLL